MGRAHVGARVYRNVFGRRGLCARHGCAAVLVTNQLHFVVQEAAEAEAVEGKAEGKGCLDKIPTDAVARGAAADSSFIHPEILQKPTKSATFPPPSSPLQHVLPPNTT